jgi:three-Cys-motif partner protein
MPNRFGTKSTHTDEKLNKLSEYLECFTTALKKQTFDLVYFDAFAGTPEIDVGNDRAPLFVDEAVPFLEGSSRRALKLGTKFSRYIFVDRKKANVRELEALKNDYPNIRDRIEIRYSDANEELREFCSNWPSNRRAVVFLDPFGNQVEWRTIEAIAATRAIDLWYLFPAGLGVHRQISKGGDHRGREESLDRLLGTPDWRTAFVTTVEVDDLFGSKTEKAKVATPVSITEFMIARMKTVFEGGVLDDWLPLGANGRHSYSLIFACANPSAGNLERRLAKEGLGSKKRGRT